MQAHLRILLLRLLDLPQPCTDVLNELHPVRDGSRVMNRRCLLFLLSLLLYLRSSRSLPAFSLYMIGSVSHSALKCLYTRRRRHLLLLMSCHRSTHCMLKARHRVEHIIVSTWAFPKLGEDSPDVAFPTLQHLHPSVVV
jgi:hypothetical protein